MTDDSPAPKSSESGLGIPDAAAVIELFGGIRPMSAKTGIAVTTIQGWKQRGVIPMSRRQDLVRAANAHGIDLSEMLIKIAEQSDKGAPEEIVLAVANSEPEHLRTIPEDMRPASSHTTLIVAGVLIISAAALGAVFAVAPKVKEVSEQEQRIRALEKEFVRMQEEEKQAQQAEAEGGTGLQFEIPKDIEAKISNLQGQVGELSSLADQAKNYTQMAKDLSSGSAEQRLAALESSIKPLLNQANVAGLQNTLHKLESMRGSAQGMGDLQQLMGAFITAGNEAETKSASETAPYIVTAKTDGTENQEEVSLPSTEGQIAAQQQDAVAAAFEKLKETDPRVAETFKDVAPEDMKAAVMLLGMSQLRVSLARDRSSFDQDLKILKMTVARDDTQLSEAIDRLAPKAKSGVLTPNGLSKELRGLTGEIVAASITGEDVSVEEKALARLGGLVKVEKDGEQISGTSTQIAIAEAQKKLDAGDVAGAVELLQTIEGPAAEKTKPIIDEAQATLLAQKVQSMSGEGIVLKLKGLAGGFATGKSGAYLASPSGLQGVTNTIESLGGPEANSFQNAVPNLPQR